MKCNCSAKIYITKKYPEHMWRHDETCDWLIDYLSHDKSAKLQNGFYCVTSERSSKTGIVELCDGNFYLINEVGPFTLEELNKRGWNVSGRLIID